MLFKYKHFLIIGVVYVLASCTSSNDVNDAIKITNEIHSFRANSDITSELNYYSKDFIEADKIKTMLDTFIKQSGNLEKYELHKVGTKMHTGTDFTAKLVLISYITTYENTKRFEQYVFKRNNENGLEIISYDLSPHSPK